MSRAEGEISDAAYRQRAAAREGHVGGPGIGWSAAASTPTSGGYSLDPEQLGRHIERFERIADRIEKQRNQWQSAADHVAPPAGDEPGTLQANQARKSIMIGWQANEEKLRRMRAFIAQMKEAREAYVDRDEDSASSFIGDADSSDDWASSSRGLFAEGER